MGSQKVLWHCSKMEWLGQNWAWYSQRCRRKPTATGPYCALEEQMAKSV